jgi:hypothetical protein
VTEGLLCKDEVLSSNPSPTEKNWKGEHKSIFYIHNLNMHENDTVKPTT